MGTVNYVCMTLVCMMVLIMFGYKAKQYSVFLHGNTHFDHLIIAAMMFCSVDIVWGICYTLSQGRSHTWLELLTYAYFGAAILMVYEWYKYVIYTMKFKWRKALQVVGIVLSILQFGLLLSNIWNKQVFEITDTYVYQGKPYRNIIYVTQMVVCWFLVFASRLTHTTEIREDEMSELKTVVKATWIPAAISICARFFAETPSYSCGFMLTCVLLYIYSFVDKVEKEKIRHLKDEKHLLQKHAKEMETAKKAAQEANEAKSVFLNNMSHDIRTPMNAIVGFAALARKHLEDRERVEDYIDKIQISSGHLLCLINDVLDMSRIEAGRVTIEEEPQSLSNIIEEIGYIVQEDAVAKGLNLTVDTKDIQDDAVWCDKLHIHQILLNCIGNAIKFTPEGGQVSLLAKQIAASDGKKAQYQLRIKDSGIGMEQDFATKIFDPFERERSSTVSGIQGTGLGMSIVKNFVELMDGSIEVETEPGLGTEIIITIEFRLATEEKIEWSEGNIAPCSHGETDFDGQLNGMNILLVEDNEMNREIASDLLTDWGAKVDAAENGQVAVNMLSSMEKEPYDMVLMDIQMPIMDGYEATRKIRQMSGDYYKELPIIAMTANAFDTDRNQALETGMNGHLSKPIEFHKLLALIQHVAKWEGFAEE